MFQAIEFDQEYFPTQESCIDWLKGSDYGFVPTIKGFKLRSSSKSVFLTHDTNRKVWSYYQELWKHSTLLVTRPTPFLVMVGRPGTVKQTAITDTFTPTDLPPLSTKTKAKEEAKRIALAEKKAKVQAEREAKAKARALLPKKTRKRKSPEKETKEEAKGDSPVEPVQNNGIPASASSSDSILSPVSDTGREEETVPDVFGELPPGMAPFSEDGTDVDPIPADTVKKSAVTAARERIKRQIRKLEHRTDVQ